MSEARAPSSIIDIPKFSLHLRVALLIVVAVGIGVFWHWPEYRELLIFCAAIGAAVGQIVVAWYTIQLLGAALNSNTRTTEAQAREIWRNRGHQTICSK